VTGPRSAGDRVAPARAPRWTGLLPVGLLVGLLVAGGWWGWQWARGATATRPTVSAEPVASDDSLGRAPVGVRVRVHVANASGVRGRARRATALLRERGFDVVLFDTERGGAALRTTVVVHAGPREWGERVRRALGAGTVELQRDSTRLVDLRVRLGRDWEPPPQALRP
jgi:hypothetical protein